MSNIGINDLTVFVDGTPAVASEINDNFTVCKDAINDNDSRITTNIANIATKQDKVTSAAVAFADSPKTLTDKQWALVDSSGGAVSIVLPTTGRCRVKWTAGTNAVTVSVTSSGTIDGSATYVIPVITASIDFESTASGVFRVV